MTTYCKGLTRMGHGENAVCGDRYYGDTYQCASCALIDFKAAREACEKATVALAATAAKEAMFRRTDTKHAPWTLVDFNDQRRGRLTLIRDLLDRLPDVDVPGDRPELVALRGKPGRERYSVLEPIAPWIPPKGRDAD